MEISRHEEVRILIVPVALFATRLVVAARSEQIGARVALIDRRPKRVQIANLAADGGRVSVSANATADAECLRGVCDCSTGGI